MSKHIFGHSATRTEKIKALKDQVTNFKFEAETERKIKAYIGRVADHMSEENWSQFDVPADREECLRWFAEIHSKANKGRKKSGTHKRRSKKSESKVTVEITQSEQSLLTTVNELLKLTGQSLAEYIEATSNAVAEKKAEQRAEAEQRAKDAQAELQIFEIANAEIVARYKQLMVAQQEAEQKVQSFETTTTTTTPNEPKGRRGPETRTPKESAADIRKAAYNVYGHEYGVKLDEVTGKPKFIEVASPAVATPANVALF